MTPEAASALLRGAGIPVTRQRVQIACAFLGAPAHLTAEQLVARMREQAPGLARATVYNTLGLFVAHGLVREIIVDGGSVIYDSNTAPHFHYYDSRSGELGDLPAEALRVSGMPQLPPHLELEAVDVIVRVRSRG
ncbi:MAG: transcriptional repressor [Candidatus Dactylopiibacterium sp.]|nr:transcriptional repressor [Candidatus Dactylopiibacterium sp.]